MTGLLLVLAMAVSPVAQDPAAPAAPPVPQDAPATKVAPPPAPASMTPDEFRDNINIMEGLLAAAVANGARKIQAANPGVSLVATGNPRARGFVLDGYGLFFDVEIPELSGSVELTMQLLQKEMQKQFDDRAKRDDPARRTSSAQSVAALDDPDPNEAYREAVITSIVGAMLDYSKSLNVQPNEWLTVGLRSSELPNMQVGIRDSRTVILRLKGNDLADYLASRVSKSDAIKRVDKRVF
jgi:hypothetical protein